MIEIVLDPDLAESYGGQIEEAGHGRVRLLPVRGNDPGDPDFSNAEIAVSGWYYDAKVSFADILAAMPRVRRVHSTGAGMDDFVSSELAARGVWLTNVAGAYAPAMAEYALAGMIMAARGWPAWLDAQREHRWLEREPASGRRLRGCLLGILGYGAVGRHVAQASVTLGMRVWAIRRTPTFTSGEPIEHLLAPGELHSLLRESDFVLLSASLNSSSRHLIGAAELAAMKPTAILVNVARGGLVDQDALLTALRSRRIGGAVLDVTTPEPLPAESPLWELPNVILTPHVSGDTPEGWQAGMDLFCANLRLYLDGYPERMGNLVDIRAHL